MTQQIAFDSAPRRLPGAPLGIYVHIPFCRQLCPYCDFAVAVRRDPPHEAYCDALLQELDERWSSTSERAVETLYLGGGTPAYWASSALERFFEGLHRRGLQRFQEVTIEANPLDITAERLEQWSLLGIDRVSLGVQSFDDDYLAALGRDHRGEHGRAAAEVVVADGRFRTSIDMIYGGPGHGPSILEADLGVIEKLGPDHVSAYELTVEPATVFGRLARRGELSLPADDVAANLGEELAESLASLGFDRYEVSSYGRSGDRALHNSGYWLGREYLGIGVGAHSLEIDDVIERRENTRNLRNYLDSPGQCAAERLTSRTHLGERLFLAARTRLGVRWSDLEKQFAEAVSQVVWEDVRDLCSRLMELGWVESSDEVFRPTPRGLDFADSVAAMIWEMIEPE